jgi:Fur family transcriptional regulator, peroxide stress response regulator
MSYQTQQKQAILDFVKKSKKHPTAQDVYEDVRKDMPNLSFATVYRNLDALAKSGLIKEVQFVDHKKRYEGQTHQHQHFICTKCERIIDMELSKLLNIAQAVEKMQCHTVTDYHLELIGTCAACKK